MKNVASTVAAAIGKGVLAGFAGTAAMTISSTLEAKLRGRAPSSAPARATAKMLGIKEFEDDKVTLPALDIAPPAVFWGVEEVAIDAFHHAVYAAATGVAYELLNGQRG